MDRVTISKNEFDTVCEIVSREMQGVAEKQLNESENYLVSVVISNYASFMKKILFEKGEEKDGK